MTVQPSKEPFPAFKKPGLPIKTFQLRLVRDRQPSGLIEVLATNLLNETRDPLPIFSSCTTDAEEAFRYIRCRLLLEQFGSETTLAIWKEFHAPILWHNLAILAGMDKLAQLEDAEAQTHGANLTYASHLIPLHFPRLLACPEELVALCSLILGRIAMKITRLWLGRQGSPRKPHPNQAYK